MEGGSCTFILAINKCHFLSEFGGMGSASSVIVERMSSPVVIDFWKKLVEGACQMNQISFGEKEISK